MGYELAQGCRWNGVYYVADLEAFRGIHLNQATPAKYFTRCVHATKVTRVPDSDTWSFPLKNQYNFDNGYTDIAGFNAALYSGPHIKKLDKNENLQGPADDDATIYPLRRETDLSGRLLGTVEGATGYRKKKAGRRVLVDSTFSEIRRGSRRPIGRVSTDEWNRRSPEEKSSLGRND